MRGVILAAAIVVAAACQQTGRSAAPAVSAGEGHVAASEAWANRGAHLRKAKAAHQYAPNSTDLLRNAGDWAYPSLPVLIDGPGKYVLRFGPLAPSFRGLDQGVVFSFPPDRKFRIGPSGRPKIVTIGVERFYELEFVVTEFVAPYPGFYGWIY